MAEYIAIAAKDYVKASELWKGYTPLIFRRDKSDYRPRWVATDRRGRSYSGYTYGRSCSYHVDVKCPSSDGNMVAFDFQKHWGSGTCDRWNNGFSTKAEAEHFASMLSHTDSDMKLCAASYLAPVFVSWSKVSGRKGEYFPAYRIGNVHYECFYTRQHLVAMKDTDGWKIEGDWESFNKHLPYDVGMTDAKKEFQKTQFAWMMNARFKTKADLTIGFGIFLRDIKSRASMNLSADRLVRYANVDLKYSCTAWIEKFNSIVIAASHAGLCKDTFEAHALVEAVRHAPNGLAPNAEECVQAALSILRAYGEVSRSA